MGIPISGGTVKTSTFGGEHVQSVELVRPTTATVAEVALTTGGATIKAANTARLGLWVFNDANQNLLIKMGSSASGSSFSYRVAPGELWEMPSPIYTGIVTGTWEAAGSGNARVTEF